MNKDRFESPVSTMRQLHWLPISFRCKYKMLLLVYRCMKDQAPDYLQQKLILRNPVQNTHPATESNLLHIPYNKRKTLADHGFSSAGPKLWNSLPHELQTAPTVSGFKKLLNTYLLKLVITYNSFFYSNFTVSTSL